MRPLRSSRSPLVRIGADHGGRVERREAGQHARAEVEEDRVEVAADGDRRQRLGAEQGGHHHGVGDAHPHVDEADEHDRRGEAEEGPTFVEQRAGGGLRGVAPQNRDGDRHGEAPGGRVTRAPTGWARKPKVHGGACTPPAGAGGMRLRVQNRNIAAESSLSGDVLDHGSRPRRAGAGCRRRTGSRPPAGRRSRRLEVRAEVDPVASVREVGDHVEAEVEAGTPKGCDVDGVEDEDVGAGPAGQHVVALAAVDRVGAAHTRRTGCRTRRRRSGRAKFVADHDLDLGQALDAGRRRAR